MTHPSPEPQPHGRGKSTPPSPLRRVGVIAVAMLAAAVPAALITTLAAAPAARAAASGPASLTVSFQGLKSRTGVLMLTLAGSPEAYDGKAAFTAQASVAVAGDTVAITFEGLKPGAYAIKAFHDLNGDGKLNTNPFGIPTEPYAFSNKAAAMMGPPAWKAAAFDVRAGANRQTIDID